MRESLRKSGIEIIGDVPWGAHFCQFYRTKEDLKDILVPYFKAGLENNEFCLWITSYPLGVEEAKEVLGKAVPDIDAYLEKEQIEIVSYTCLNVTGSIHDSERIINGWIEKLNNALESGYEGLRLSGNTSWLEKKEWDYFVDYMGKMDDIVGKYRMIALGSYFADKYDITEMIEIVSNHQFSLSKKEGKLERIDNFGRKKAEEEAIRATKDWEHTFDAVPDPIAIIDTKYLIVRANKAMATKLRVTPKECIGLTCYRVIHGTSEPPSFCPHQQLLNNGLEHTAEIYEDCLGGYFMVSTSPLYDSEGKIIGSIYVARDINDRKQAEEALKKVYESLEEKVKARTVQLEKAYNSLKESEKGFAEAQKMAHVGNWEWDVATDKAYWSDELYRIYGRNPQKLAPSYNEYLNYVHPDDREYADNAHKKAINGKAFSIDHRIILDTGEVRTVHIQTEIIFDDDNVPIRLKGIVQDITERKRAEGSLQESEARLRRFYESGMFGVLYYKLDGSIIDANDKFLEIVGYTREDLKAGWVRWDKMTPPEYRHLDEHAISELKATGTSMQFEKEYTRKDGSRVPIIIGVATFDKESDEGIAFVLDITERKKAEEALAKAEDARKKEIHHRIKNNLQVISSLLDLQAEKFNDVNVIEAFRESQNRVISMALIHEELYEGGGTDTLNFSEYIQKLAENLFQTYRLSGKNRHLCTDMEENAFINMDTAVPLGIIVNELVSNSLKHAFKGRDEGEIRIKLHREENRKSNSEGCKSANFTLTVSDDGVGIPESIDIGDLDSLGLQLVTTLVDQLDGKLELKRDNGTEFTIRFTVAEKDNPTSMPAP